MTLGGAVLFVLFGIIYLYESFYGGDIDLSPVNDALSSSKGGLNAAALIDLAPPNGLAQNQGFVEKTRRAILAMME